MDGLGLMTSPPPRFPGPRFGSYQHRGAPRQEGPYTFNFRAPSMPGQGGNQSCDGKKPRTKVVTRKTVDYNTTVCSYVQNRIWQRDYRDARAVQPEALYYPHLKPPADMLEHPMNCVLTKHVRTASNKVRCPVFCVCWTPEGRRLITGASSGEFTLWNGLTFSFETILQAHDTSVRSMIWSHNEQWLLSGDHGGYVKYWQLNMNNVKMYQAHKDPVRGLSFSPTDQKYTSCSDDGTVRIWDFLRCHEERIFRGHGADVKCVDWHPNKGLIASGSRDNQQPIILWDPRMGQKLSTVHAHKHTVMAVEFNRNGNWLLTASRDHLIKLFDIRNFKEEMQSFKGHMKEATAVAWHPIHENLFTSGGSDGQVMFWLVGHEREVGSINEAHDSLIWSAAWHPLGHILVTGSNDHNTRFWTRNRPGDGMRDQYNLNTLPAGADEMADYVDELEVCQTSTVASASSVPATGTEYMQQSDQKKDAADKPSTGTDAPVIPGLDFSGVIDLPEEPAEENKDKDSRRKMPYAKHIPRDFVRAWQDGKQPEIISQQLEQHERQDTGSKQQQNMPSKPRPPSLLDLPLQVPRSMKDNPQHQSNMQQDGEQQQMYGAEQAHQEHLQQQQQQQEQLQQQQQQQVYNEGGHYQQEEDLPSLPGLGGPVPKELPKGSLLGQWPGEPDGGFRTSKNQAFNFEIAQQQQQQKTPLLPSPKSQQQTQQAPPVEDLSKFYSYESEIDRMKDQKYPPPLPPPMPMPTKELHEQKIHGPAVISGMVAKKPDLNAFYNYEEDDPSNIHSSNSENIPSGNMDQIKKSATQRQGPNMNPRYRNSNSSIAQGQGQGSDVLSFEKSSNSNATGFQNTDDSSFIADDSRDFNQGRRKTSFIQDNGNTGNAKMNDYRNQGSNSYTKNNSHRPESVMNNSYHSGYDQENSGYNNPKREQRGSWSNNRDTSKNQPMKRGFNEGPGEESSIGGGDRPRSGGGFNKSRGSDNDRSNSGEGFRGSRGSRGNSSRGSGGRGGSRGGSGFRGGGRGRSSRGRPR